MIEIKNDEVFIYFDKKEYQVKANGSVDCKLKKARESIKKLKQVKKINSDFSINNFNFI